MKQYRKGEAADPDIYVTSVAAVLAHYPEDTIRYVTDPFTGISATVKFRSFMPNPGEVKGACEDHYGPKRFAKQFQIAARKQAAERDEHLLEHHKPRKTHEQIADDFAQVGIIFGERAKPSLPPIDVNALCDAHGVSKEQWDAIPNLPPDKWKKLG